MVWETANLSTVPYPSFSRLVAADYNKSCWNEVHHHSMASVSSERTVWIAFRLKRLNKQLSCPILMTNFSNAPIWEANCWMSPVRNSWLRGENWISSFSKSYALAVPLHPLPLYRSGAFLVQIIWQMQWLLWKA